MSGPFVSQEIDDEQKAIALVDQASQSVWAFSVVEQRSHHPVADVLLHGMLLGLYAPEWCQGLLAHLELSSKSGRPPQEQVRDYVAKHPVVRRATAGMPSTAPRTAQNGAFRPPADAQEGGRP